VEEWLSAGYYAGLQRSVESPYTPLNAALAPKVAPPAVSQNVMTLPRRVRDALEDFYKEIYPEFGVDSPANIKDFYLERGARRRSPSPDRMSTDSARSQSSGSGMLESPDAFKPPKALPFSARANGL